jgi:putative tryptophan/tyrosine transport system substrate-binding protein
VKRRQFIAGLGSAVAWTAVARAQQRERLRRIGVLMGYDEKDQTAKGYFSELVRGLGELGWSDGRNLRMDARWAAGVPERMRIFAKELVDMQPDVIVVNSAGATKALQQQTRTIPLVFLLAGDPVGNDIVRNISHPEANITGFTYESAIGGKWLELLKEIVPRVNEILVLVYPDNPTWKFHLPAIEAASRPSAMQVTAIQVQNPSEIQRAIGSFAGKPNAGMITLPSPFAQAHRELIIALAAKHRLPAIYAIRSYVTSGGLISYSSDWVDQYRQAASYVDRIFRGVRPADLPIQQPTRFELAINLKTAKALGLIVPDKLLALADAVIE